MLLLSATSDEDEAQMNGVVVAAAWAGVAFGLSLQMTTWMHFPHTWPVALLPWTLVALERVARGERHGGKALVGTVLLLVLGGYPEGEFFVAACGIVFFVAILVRHARSGRDRWRRSESAVLRAPF